MRQLLHRVLDFLGELLPARRQPGDAADGPRHFHLGAVQLALPPAPHLLVAERNGFQLVDQLLLPLVQRDDLGELAANFGLLLGVGGTAFFDIAQIHEIVEFFVAVLQQLGDLNHAQLNQRGPADGLLHAQLAALHAARQIDFAFAGEQRNGAHFAQIHAYRIVGVNRLFDLLRSRKFLVLNFLGMEEIRFFVERNPEGLVTVG